MLTPSPLPQLIKTDTVTEETREGKLAKASFQTLSCKRILLKWVERQTPLQNISHPLVDVALLSQMNGNRCCWPWVPSSFSAPAWFSLLQYGHYPHMKWELFGMKDIGPDHPGPLKILWIFVNQPNSIPDSRLNSCYVQTREDYIFPALLGKKETSFPTWGTFLEPVLVTSSGHILNPQKICFLFFSTDIYIWVMAKTDSSSRTLRLEGDLKAEGEKKAVGHREEAQESPSTGASEYFSWKKKSPVRIYSKGLGKVDNLSAEPA